jgi:predicted Rossmann fold flavoprotein
MPRVIVVGGGPAGLMAAGQAALRGMKVVLLEKKDRPARKLRLTGNGRCNLTNMALLEEFSAHFGRNGKFLRPAFSRFFVPKLMQFFEDLDVRLTTDERGRVYPKSDNADEVADALLDWSARCGAKISNNSAVTEIIPKKNCIKIVLLSGKAGAIPADAVIIATGGASYPSTGSTGDGYRLAEALGHSIVPIRPASVPLDLFPDIAAQLRGLSLKSVIVKTKNRKKKSIKVAGDLLFTHFGVSGPVILPISRFCVDQLKSGNRPVLTVDFLPEYDESRLEQNLQWNFLEHGKSQIQTILGKLLPQRMVRLLLRRIGTEPQKPCNQVSADERRRIKLLLKNFDLTVIGHRSFAEAMVTAGGINLNEVDPRTMESRLIKGLHFAGEVLDLDADTGGFNLQAAFSTGWLAGRMCAI